MRLSSAFLILFSFLIVSNSFSQNEYFFPEGIEFDPNVPTPESFLGYAIGDFHTRIDRMASYMEKLAEVSPKVNYKVIGYTNEMRPQVILTITSPSNYNNLENIRLVHLNSADPSKPAGDYANMPSIIHLGYNVHGNEPSSTEASMLAAYYLIASNEPAVNDYLNNAVILIEPALNPDGRDRHSGWANTHKAIQLVADPLDREHNEVWPFGRTNHYWFDLNRDWLPLAHVESRNRVEHFHQWLPNVVTDYHEMGSNATYFFEPTKPFGSENPVVPRSNYDQLNTLFAKYFKEALDDIGSLYWTKEVFDNSYPGYGSTYPDIHGGLGLVFEQASSRGHLQRTSTGEITFAFTIRNHLRTSIATVKAGVENKELLLRHQRDFFVDAQNAGKRSPIKAYVAGDANNHNLNQYFLELLLRHNIKCYKLSRTITSGGLSFQPGSAILVPTDQPQYLMVRTIFEKVKQFADSVFYDASAWSMALSYGIPHAEVRGSSVSLGEQLSFDDLKPANRTVSEASYAYLMDWKDYNSPKALYHLLKNGVNAKTAFKQFEASVDGSNKKFGYGSIMIPVFGQKADENQLHRIVQEAATLGNIDIFPVATGMNISGIDLGSNNFRTVKQPKAIMVIGEGTSSYEAGEVWHLMDTRVGMPITKIDIIDFNRANLNDYTVLILVSGNYNSLNKDKIKSWLEGGGTLVTQRTANNWIIKNELVSEKLVEEEKDEKGNTKTPRIDFVDARNFTGAMAIGGSFYETDIDITHPVAFGYTNKRLTVYKNNKVFLEPSKNPFATVGVYTSNPWLSGYIHSGNLKKISNSASLIVTKKGRGRVIMFTDNPNFRSMMYGTNKLFLNAVFFGPLINVPSGN